MTDFLFVLAWVSIVLAPSLFALFQPVAVKNSSSDVRPKDLMRPLPAVNRARRR
jgi:hypothetical protein